MIANGAYWMSITIGAIFYYLMSGFSNSFEYHNTKEKRRRNLWTGYAIQMISLFLVIFLIVKYKII